jgi:hypothetical protein
MPETNQAKLGRYWTFLTTASGIRVEVHVEGGEKLETGECLMPSDRVSKTLVGEPTPVNELEGFYRQLRGVLGPKGTTLAGDADKTLQEKVAAANQNHRSPGLTGPNGADFCLTEFFAVQYAGEKDGSPVQVKRELRSRGDGERVVATAVWTIWISPDVLHCAAKLSGQQQLGDSLAVNANESWEDMIRDATFDFETVQDPTQQPSSVLPDGSSIKSGSTSTSANDRHHKPFPAEGSSENENGKRSLITGDEADGHERKRVRSGSLASIDSLPGGISAKSFAEYTSSKAQT